MSDHKPPANHDVGFPSLSWEDDFLDTRPLPLHEIPLQARVDMAMALVAQYHVRIALAVETFWGHQDCVEYLQKLVLGGYKEGEKRMGFKPEVLSALINLVDLHRQIFGAQDRP